MTDRTFRLTPEMRALIERARNSAMTAPNNPALIEGAETIEKIPRRKTKLPPPRRRQLPDGRVLHVTKGWKLR